jgi:surfactin synthase thioesterase subunit
VCIPWAGAGAAPFRSWGPVIGDAATVYGVRLAGRESRQTEPPATAHDEVVAELAGDVLELGTPRVALFGQCSGALLAFEVARALRGSGHSCEVIHLVVASQLPPSVVASARIESDQDLMRYVSKDLHDEPELLDVLLPILTADMKLVSGYTYSPDAPLDVPLTVVYGARDELLDMAEVDGWRQETTGTTNVREIAEADHLFDGAAWLDLATAIRAELT